ncbi:MAG: ribose-phosphate pyrophosphokinase, partial [Dongiaceae bacterium]
LGVVLAPADIGSFFYTETRVRVTPEVRGADIFILQSTSPPVNDHLIALAQLIDACRAAGAKRITALAPYFGYARQDQRSRVGDPRSAQIVARLLGAVELDHLVTLDLHAPSLESALPMPCTLLRADELFLPLIKSWGVKDLVIVAPDAGGLKRAQRYATELDADLSAIAKDRPQPDMATPRRVLGDVHGRACVIVDDMASTGRTLVGAAEALRRSGAREVHAVFTHAVMAADALERLLAAPLERIATTDSVPAAPHPRIEVVSIAGLLAKTVRDVHEDPRTSNPLSDSPRRAASSASGSASMD